MSHTTKSNKSSKRDKLKHSAKAYRAKSPKGGSGGKGTWGGAADEMNDYDLDKIREDTTYNPEDEDYEEDYDEEEENVQEEQAPKDEEQEDDEVIFRVQIWNIPRGKQKQVRDMIKQSPGWIKTTGNYRRPFCFAEFNSLENADKALSLNNTLVGKKYVGVRYAQVLADHLSGSKPTEDNSKPTEGDSKPTEDDSKPTEDDSKPTEDDSKPTEDDSKPTEEPTEETNI